LEIEEYLRRRKTILKHLENRKENQEEYWLILNSSSGDDIKWIDQNSQDFVVIAHTLSHIYNKSDWDIIDFIKQWYKVLKADWKIRIIDYLWDLPELEKLFEKTELKEYYKVNKGSFVCCFDKKWLGKFLENELK
jgi:predicted SAM-dependent methyltransferase